MYIFIKKNIHTLLLRLMLRLTPSQVATAIEHFGESKHISKALRVFYQHEKNSTTASALVAAFVGTDLLSAWKVYRQFSPLPCASLSALATAHAGKHPDYLRDNTRFAGISHMDAAVTNIVHSANIAGLYRTSVDLFSQVSAFESPVLCSAAAIKAFAHLGDVSMTTQLYLTNKCHASMARVLPESQLVDFLATIVNDERTEELYSVVSARLDGDARFTVEQEMKERFNKQVLHYSLIFLKNTRVSNVLLRAFLRLGQRRAKHRQAHSKRY